MANAILLRPLVAAVTAASTAPGFSADYLLNDFAGVMWRSAAGGSSVLTADFGTAASIDSLMLFGIVDGQPGYRFSLTAADDAAFTANVITPAANQPLFAGSAMPVAGRGVALWLSEAPIARRFWRIDVRSATNQPVQIGAARLVMGERIRLERNFSNGASLGVKDLGSVEFSRRGVPLPTPGAKLRTAALTFSSLRRDEVEAKTKPLLERIGNTGFIALVTDPAEHEQRQNRCYFGPLVGDLGHTIRRADAWEAKVNLVSIF